MTPADPVNASFSSRLAPPRLIRWLATVGLVILGITTAFRVLALGTFVRPEDSAEAIARILVLGLRYDLRLVALLLLPALVIGSIRALQPFASRTAARAWLAAAALAVATVALVQIIDAFHLRYLQQRLNASVLGFLTDAGISAEMAWQSYPIVRVALAWLLGSAALAAVLVWRHRVAARSPDAATRRARWTWGVGAGVCGIVAIYGRVSQYPLRWSDAFDLRDHLHAHLALSPVESFVSSLDFRGSGYDEARVRAHAPRVGAYLGAPGLTAKGLDFVRHGGPAAPEAPPVGPVRRAPRNVVLVICESFSGYKSSVWGNPIDTTPYFAQLCREGVLFDNCYTPHFGTARGIWALLTGIPDVEMTKTATRNPALVDQHVILNDFTAAEKLYFLGGSASWANVRGLLANNVRGLRIYEEDAFRSPRVDVWGISDTSLFLEANGILAREEKPFFAVIQTAGNHRPYTIPPADRGAFALIEASPAELAAAGFESNEELNAFRYTDFSFRAFIEAARKERYFADTLFVFIGDHGIGGNAGSRFPRSWTEQGLTAFHTPLLFYAPGLLEPRRISSVASMVDVLPTIAGIAGISYRNGSLGRDLLRQEQIDGGASNVAFIIDHHNQTVGVRRGLWYATRRFAGGAARHDWADWRHPAPSLSLVPPPALAEENETWIDALQQTSRYLLFHNRKPARGDAPPGSSR
jgi:hypothetical protein